MDESFEFEIAFCERVLKRNPDYLDVLEMLAHYYTKAGRIVDGLKADRRIVELAPENPTAFYNLACSLSLSHQLDESVRCLREALVRGYQDFDWMMKDPDLRPLKSFPPFRRLINEFRIEKS